MQLTIKAPDIGRIALYLAAFMGIGRRVGKVVGLFVSFYFRVENDKLESYRKYVSLLC